MARVNYQVLQIDLAVQRTAEAVPGVGQGVAFDAVTVHQLPLGANVSLGINSSSQMIPLLREETFRILDSCEHPFLTDEGLFITNAAGAGTLILILSSGTTPQVAP